MRLDNYLVENNFARSRNKAQEFIKQGLVFVNDKEMLKSSYHVLAEDKVSMESHKNYLSRAAYKLSHFLDELSLDVSGLRALDVGASTGGFTQVLLEYGAQSVSAVDVGKAQLHPSLKEDTRVKSFESCDIRYFKSEEAFELVVSDVSFISLHHILEDVDRLSCAHIILLFKPQFEVGKEAKRDKNGVVLDQRAIERAMVHFEDACTLKGWRQLRKSASKITGKEGNLEYCYYFKKD
ncbi:MAG: TlyA family RNA methyltransferase [Sulfurimonas sp.]|jgi:23S rRNA (cytidine1920-2'-O)/16S rRNA (cytidine1409-2'-O)-methyltransferase|nr:TlyA family RNA methyltransferase [Sulfurimonas sp.]